MGGAAVTEVSTTMSRSLPEPPRVAGVIAAALLRCLRAGSGCPYPLVRFGRVVLEGDGPAAQVARVCCDAGVDLRE
ncbi:hypothetical protein GCM10009530_78150 [Microbispora corallina]